MNSHQNASYAGGKAGRPEGRPLRMLLVGVAVLVYVPFWRKQKKEDDDR